MTLDPYSGTAKLVLYALVALAILGAIARWRYVEGALRTTRGEVARLEADAAARAKNEDIAAIIRRGYAKQAETRRVSVARETKGVYDARKPVPEACVPALEPLQRALDGVRSLRSERGAAPSRPDLRPRPASPFVG